MITPPRRLFLSALFKAVTALPVPLKWRHRIRYPHLSSEANTSAAPKCRYPVLQSNVTRSEKVAR